MKWIGILICTWFCHTATGQVMTDKIFKDRIKSVKLHHKGLPESQPIININSSGALLLSFDDLQTDELTYTYRITHCDRNWVPTELDESYYLQGFQDEEIWDIEYSRGTRVDYVNYQLELPNEDTEWLLSGNYVIEVHEDSDLDKLVLRKRFHVVEQKVQVVSEALPARGSTFTNAMQQLDFYIEQGDFQIQDPLMDVSVVIAKNYDWLHALNDIKPISTDDSRILFRRTLSAFSFPSINEFRFADLRSTYARSNGVNTLEVLDNEINVLLHLQSPRANIGFITFDDINGNFVLTNNDQSDPRVSSEYVNTIFSLDIGSSIAHDDIYIYGALSNWEIDEKFKMSYDLRNQIYLSKILLKQGYYDYMFVTENEDGTPNFEIEGNRIETENDYSILVYYRPFGARYDGIIASRTVSSRR